MSLRRSQCPLQLLRPLLAKTARKWKGFSSPLILSASFGRYLYTSTRPSLPIADTHDARFNSCESLGWYLYESSLIATLNPASQSFVRTTCRSLLYVQFSHVEERSWQKARASDARCSFSRSFVAEIITNLATLQYYIRRSPIPKRPFAIHFVIVLPKQASSSQKAGVVPCAHLTIPTRQHRKLAQLSTNGRFVYPPCMIHECGNRSAFRSHTLTQNALFAQTRRTGRQKGVLSGRIDRVAGCEWLGGSCMQHFARAGLLHAV